MNTKKGFTLIELLVVVAIAAIFIGIAFTVISAARNADQTSTERLPWFASSEYRRAYAEENEAMELKRANELKEQELELLRQKLKSER